MKPKFKTICFAVLATAGFSLGAAYALSYRSETPERLSADSTYTLTLGEGVDVADTYGTVTSASGTTFGFKFTDYSKGSGTLGSFASGGELLNWDAFHSIQSITVRNTSGTLAFYNGWKQYDSSDIEYSSSAYQTISGSGTHAIDLSSIDPSYFKLVATSDCAIDSISIVYTCASTSVNSNLRIRVAKPTIGGEEATIAASNYVWINTNVKDAGTWTNYVMTRDADGSWYADFNNVSAASSGYTYSLVVCDSNSDIDWTYPAVAGTVRFGIGEGQTELNIDSVDFGNQPHESAGTYTLNLTIKTTGTPTSFGNIQFVHNYSNKTDNYTWDKTISSSWKSSYSYSMIGLDASAYLYFRLYMWSDSTNIYVGSASSNFKIAPANETTVSATITFDYSASSTIGGTFVVDGESDGLMSHANVNLSVYGTSAIAPTFDGSSETFTASYSGENIRIDDNSTIVGIKAGTTTTVKLTSYTGLTCSFDVTVASSAYSAKWDANWCDTGAAISATEGWFNSTTVGEIAGMGKDFYNGVDVSSFKALVDNGSKFYNPDGVEQHLLYILKAAGVNWVRLKLWVDPKSSTGISYGGGESNLANTLWMAKEVKAAGLNFLLDFHYSDYWTHPSQQIIPKAWNDCASKSELCAQIKSYTTETLTAFEDAGCLPEMVQLGNEISSGIYLQKYSGGTESLNAYGEPSYLTDNSSYAYGTSTASEYTDYIKAASEGVDAVDSSIKKVLHWAKGSSISASVINNFFNAMPSSYYDYAAISFYPYYCFDTLNAAQTILNGLSLSKPWFVAETSYPFSGKGYVYYNSTNYTNFTISSDTKKGITSISSSYSFNAAGQANLIHDLTSAVVSAGGKGIFYWEPAWIPNLSVGWAGAGSLNTWGNQGFFSFDGKAIANLDLFAQMSPHI